MKQHRSLAVVLMLLLSGCESRDEHDMTPLMHAAQKGDTAQIRSLLDQGADLEAKVEDHSSLRYLIAFLMWMQELPDRSPGYTPLLFAVDSSHDAAVLQLLDAGADISVAADSMTALDLAITRKDLQMARLLLERGAMPRPPRGYLPQPLAVVAGENDTTLVRMLLARGAPVNAGDVNGHTALMTAAEHGATEAFAVLLKAGADPGARDRIGWTAARYAMANDHGDIAAQVASHPAVAADLASESLFAAIRAQDIAALKSALKNGADPNASNEGGRSMLVEAASAFPESTLFELMDAGAVIRKDEAQSLLFISVARGHLKLFDKLIGMGVQPGRDYIAYAVRADQVEIVERLLELGLDPEVWDPTQHSATELARLLDKPEMTRLIEAHTSRRATTSTN